jgi:hypothetical protein
MDITLFPFQCPHIQLSCILCIVLPTRPDFRRSDGTGRFWLRSVCIYGPNRERIPRMCLLFKNKKETASLEATDSPLFVATVCLWSEFDDGVQRHFYVGQIGLR